MPYFYNINNKKIQRSWDRADFAEIKLYWNKISHYNIKAGIWTTSEKIQYVTYVTKYGTGLLGETTSWQVCSKLSVVGHTINLKWPCAEHYERSDGRRVQPLFVKKNFNTKLFVYNYRQLLLSTQQPVQNVALIWYYLGTVVFLRKSCHKNSWWSWGPMLDRSSEHRSTIDTWTSPTKAIVAGWWGSGEGGGGRRRQ